MQYTLVVLLMSRLALASPIFRVTDRDGPTFDSTYKLPIPGSKEFWYKIIISMALVLAGGVFSGYVRLISCPTKTTRGTQCLNIISLTLGLMGLDQLHLRVLAASSTDLNERANAKKGPLTTYASKSPLPNHPNSVLNLMQGGRHWMLIRELSFVLVYP
jgi:metal transporter CNNM